MQNSPKPAAKPGPQVSNDSKAITSDAVLASALNQPDPIRNGKQVAPKSIFNRNEGGQ